MALTYYVRCMFAWTSPEGTRAVIDPFGNRDDWPWFLVPTPAVKADVAMVTHDHFDHAAASLRACVG